jgi:hypothetical protein
MPRPRKISKEILEAALVGLEERRHSLDEKISELRATLGSSKGAAAFDFGARAKKRHFSDATRAKMAAAQRKRWARRRKGRGRTAAAQREPSSD